MAVVPSLNDIRLITPVLEDILMLDVYNYALSFLRRRFAYVFNQLNVKSVDAFIEDIRKGNLIDDFLFHFQVSDTEMFRDPSFWRTLKNKILPKYSSEDLIIWIPDLASSHELCSLLVILKEDKLIESTKIFCSSPSLKLIEEVQKGCMLTKTLEVSRQNFKRLELQTTFDDYFVSELGVTKIDASLFNNVKFINSSFFHEGPEGNADIVLFRNRMIYYNSKLQNKAEDEILKYIKKNGFLAIGIKERICNNNIDLCHAYDHNEQIYQV